MSAITKPFAGLWDFSAQQESLQYVVKKEGYRRVGVWHHPVSCVGLILLDYEDKTRSPLPDPERDEKFPLMSG
jgi:hypothetical protein